LYGLSDHARSVAGSVAALLVVFHASAVTEVYVTLALVVPGDVSFLPVFILEAVNRVISVVFKFVPLRLGVDEAGSGMVSEVLRLGTAAGVSLAIVRKARVLTFGAIGIALLAVRGWSMRRLVAESAGDLRP
jgi:hypothetical protein